MLRTIYGGQEPEPERMFPFDGCGIPAALGHGEEPLQIGDPDPVVGDGEAGLCLVVVKCDLARSRPPGVLHELAEHGRLVRETELEVTHERLLVHLECHLVSHDEPPSS